MVTITYAPFGPQYGAMQSLQYVRDDAVWLNMIAGICKTNSDDVLASPTKNTRKRKSTIPAVDKPAMATRGKRGNK